MLVVQLDRQAWTGWMVSMDQTAPTESQVRTVLMDSSAIQALRALQVRRGLSERREQTVPPHQTGRTATKAARVSEGIRASKVLKASQALTDHQEATVRLGLKVPAALLVTKVWLVFKVTPAWKDLPACLVLTVSQAVTGPRVPTEPQVLMAPLVHQVRPASLALMDLTVTQAQPAWMEHRVPWAHKAQTATKVRKVHRALQGSTAPATNVVQLDRQAWTGWTERQELTGQRDSKAKPSLDVVALVLLVLLVTTVVTESKGLMGFKVHAGRLA